MDTLAAATNATVNVPSFSLSVTAAFVIGLVLGVILRGKF